ncbi:MULTISPECIES: VUT family protein [unclassified Serratia (in: enterobacteria)]|uniref:VUT family protein n=1 Tax=unclassified Serratia (in: enterobacteria) TaxID=2647522 RepID=UPI003FA71730
MYGRKHARNVILIGSLSLLFASLFIYLSINLSSIDQGSGEHYNFVFSNLPYLFVINALCLLLADGINNSIYSRMKLYSNGNFLLLRCLISIVFGQFLYSVIWILLFFGAELGWRELLGYVFSNYLFKLLYSFFVCIPLTFSTVIFIRYFFFNRAVIR